MKRLRLRADGPGRHAGTGEPEPVPGQAVSDETIQFRALPDEPGPAPVPVSRDLEVLQRVLDGLRALPAGPQEPGQPGAYLRAAMPGIKNPWEPLTGSPSFAGINHGPGGLVQAGLYLGDKDEDGLFVIDVQDPVWLAELIEAATEALDVMVTGLDRGQAA